MFHSLVFRRERPKVIPNLFYALTFVRSMGGGKRTFPGGLNKWQWKRLHEKRACEKEKRLLEQEKQLYQARVRSQIRAKMAGQESDSNLHKQQSESDYNLLSPQDHVKALADHFMKEGAEDLWNENDGPIHSPRPQPLASRTRSIHQTINLRKLISDNRKGGVSGSLNDWSKPRNYSTYTCCHASSSFNSIDDGGSLISTNSCKFSNFRCYEVGRRSRRRFSSKVKFIRSESSSSRYYDSVNYGDEEEEEGEIKSKGNVTEFRSSAALGKYDQKVKKRVPLKFEENKEDLSNQVEAIRKQFDKSNLKEHVEIEEKPDDESYLSQKRFDECDVSPLTVKALTAAGYVHMTKVQEATLAACLEGKDALVKAKTGTGKTAAFLLPAIETVLNALSSNTIQQIQPIYVLILCPTRELASQIAAEANVLVKYHDGIGVLTLVGGTRFKDDHRRLESDPSQVIVATPGRLLDHIENKSGFSVRLMGLKMLVLDEADRLLDLGFRIDVEKIVDCLPRKKHSLLFSATTPKEVRQISQLVLKRDHAYIDMVGLGNPETHVKVKQMYLVAPHEQHFHIVHYLLKDHISRFVDYKIIVFCTTANMTTLVFSLLWEMKMNVREIHSKKAQLYRTRISDEFRESKRLILITSDVSARGLNYPDVTLVIQMGIPFNRAQYIHRLGRTGREGKEGEGILLLAPWEEYFLDVIKDLPLYKFPLLHLDLDSKAKIDASMTKIDTNVKEAAYLAWLGYYNSIREIGRDKTTLAELGNKFCLSIGLQKPPPLFRKTAVKMGLRHIPGIRIHRS